MSASQQQTIPSGTVTFLFTDIEGSTRMAQENPAAWEAARARHHAIVRAACDAHLGYVFQIAGDAFCVAFAQALDSLQAALQAQRALRDEAWGATPVRVRMGIHTGPAYWRNGEYEGYLTLARAQRIMSAGHGGQVLLSLISAELVRGELPAETSLRELGEHRLKSLNQPESLFQLVAPDLPADFPPLSGIQGRPNNLPTQLTSFIGREREITEVVQLLESTRLLTLTGSGGTGKTRLSLAVAGEALDQYSDGVWFVELAPLTDPAFIPQTVASALGLREETNRPILETLTDYLRDKQLLLVLDNCEHLVAACASLADALLHAAPRLTVLASSREALAIAGESAYHVPSLETPNPKNQIPNEQLRDYAAVRLFVERARAAKSGFVLTDANTEAVAQICTRLDGIPLAIELAAARIKIFAPEQIAARLDDRFRLLTGGSRTALPRQQTLRALIDWSYGLLSEPARVLLRRLSVFAGGWTFEAAEAVCVGDGIETADVLDLLTHLVEKSLVAADDEGGETRHRMLETVRQYGQEKLLESGEGGSLRTRHLEYFVWVAEQFDANFFGPEQVTWLNQLEKELDNLRVAIEWSRERSGATLGARLTGGLGWFWYLRHPAEGFDHISRTLQESVTERSESHLRSLFWRGTLQLVRGDYSAAMRSMEEVISLARAYDAETLVTASLIQLGRVAYAQHDIATAESALAEALARARRANQPWQMGMGLYYLGDIVMDRGDIEQAHALYEESASSFRSLDEKLSLAIAVRRLGVVALRRGNTEKASDLIRESFDLNLLGGDMRGVAACFTAWADLALTRQLALNAVRLLGEAQSLLDIMHTTLFPFDNLQYIRILDALSTHIDPVDFEAALAEGRALTMEQAVALAMEDA